MTSKGAASAALNRSSIMPIVDHGFIFSVRFKVLEVLIECTNYAS